MRTTVNLDEALLVQAKEIAARSHRTLGEVIDDALRLLVARRPSANSDVVTLPTFGGSGLQPGVDLEDKDGLESLLDAGDDARAAG